MILMCLAEALLRIPDDATADNLIADKISAGHWAANLSEGESLFVNASTWGLMLTGRIVRPSDTDMHRRQLGAPRTDRHGRRAVELQQRRSALRALYAQEQIADRVAELLAGYMDELSIGDPMLLTTDVGPVIASKRMVGQLASLAVTHRIGFGSAG